MKHTEQKSYFDGVNITRVPILRQNLKSTASESSENPPLKRPRLKERFIIAHQLPFCILANDTLLYAGYRKFYRKLCPQPSDSTLHSLRIDGPSLYQILTRLPYLKMVTSVEQAMNIHQQHVSNRLALRNFYNSKKRVKLKRTCEMQNDRFRRRLCAKERTFLIGKKEAGHALSCSSETETRGYGGKWKQCMHGMNINVCITNENMTSQTCMYCFSKLGNPIHRKTIKKSRKKDSLPALAIGLSGLCLLLFQETFPELSAKISHCNTEFISKTASFLNARECWDTGHDASNRGKSKTFEKKKNGF
ncbi:hypothetical protein AB4K20DRAFT_1975853 [Rhizopus microsporus]